MPRLVGRDGLEVYRNAESPEKIKTLPPLSSSTSESSTTTTHNAYRHPRGPPKHPKVLGSPPPGHHILVNAPRPLGEDGGDPRDFIPQPIYILSEARDGTTPCTVPYPIDVSKSTAVPAVLARERPTVWQQIPPGDGSLHYETSGHRLVSLFKLTALKGMKT